MSDENLLDLPAKIDAPITASHGIAALALNFAMKWHDMRLIKDGAMYQQKKLEGANIQLIDLRHVFNTASAFEAWIIDSPNRLSEIVIERVGEVIEEAIKADNGEFVTESGADK